MKYLFKKKIMFFVFHNFCDFWNSVVKNVKKPWKSLKINRHLWFINFNYFRCYIIKTVQTFSLLIFSGITITHLYPFTQHANASPMPEFYKQLKFNLKLYITVWSDKREKN